MKKRAPLLILFAATALCIPLTIQKNSYLKNRPPQKDFNYLPNTEFVSIISMGHKTTLAGLLWIDAVVYFGGNLIEGKESVWMLHLIDLITTLDPKFKSGYEFVGTVIDNAKDSLDIKLLQRGVDIFPDDWRLSLYYSLRIIEKDSNYIQASEVMKRFEERGDVPEYVKHINRFFLAESNPLPIALTIYLSDYIAIEDAVLRKGIEKRILLLNDKISLSEQQKIHELLEQLVNQSNDWQMIYKKLLIILS
jgi:hypothetical protein